MSRTMTIQQFDPKRHIQTGIIAIVNHDLNYARQACKEWLFRMNIKQATVFLNPTNKKQEQRAKIFYNEFVSDDEIYTLDKLVVYKNQAIVLDAFDMGEMKKDTKQAVRWLLINCRILNLHVFCLSKSVGCWSFRDMCRIDILSLTLPISTADTERIYEQLVFRKVFHSIHSLQTMLSVVGMSPANQLVIDTVKNRIYHSQCVPSSHLHIMNGWHIDGGEEEEQKEESRKQGK